jgi:hypothetical protein
VGWPYHRVVGVPGGDVIWHGAQERLKHGIHGLRRNVALLDNRLVYEQAGIRLGLISRLFNKAILSSTLESLYINGLKTLAKVLPIDREGNVGRLYWETPLRRPGWGVVGCTQNGAFPAGVGGGRGGGGIHTQMGHFTMRVRHRRRGADNRLVQYNGLHTLRAEAAAG